MGLGKMFVGGSGGGVFAVGRWQWWAGAESGAGAGGELSVPGVSRRRSLAWAAEVGFLSATGPHTRLFRLLP